MSKVFYGIALIGAIVGCAVPVIALVIYVVRLIMAYN